MGEAKRRKKLDPYFGKPECFKPEYRQFYQITEQLIEKVHQCQQQYKTGFVLIFPTDNLEILPRYDAQNSPQLKFFDRVYPNDDIVIINLKSVSLSPDKTIISFPWRPHQIESGYYNPKKNNVVHKKTVR